MMRRWEIECQFSSGFMAEHGTKTTVQVTSQTRLDAEHKARVQACTAIGVSTMFHGRMKIVETKDIGRA